MLVLRAQDGTVSGSVIDRSGSPVVPRELGQHLSSMIFVLVDFQPRPGGVLYHAGVESSVSCLERNGLRHLRADLPVASDGSPEVLRWSPDGILLTIAAKRTMRMKMVMLGALHCASMSTTPGIAKSVSS